MAGKEKLKIQRNPSCPECNGKTSSIWRRNTKEFERLFGVFYCPVCDIFIESKVFVKFRRRNYKPTKKQIKNRWRKKE